MNITTSTSNQISRVTLVPRPKLTILLKTIQETKMKTLLKILLVVLLTGSNLFANSTNYKLTLSNLNYTSPNSLEFDIYLLNSSSAGEELKYSLGQYFLEFNSKIANGGELTYSMVSSELSESMRPRNPKVSGNILQLAPNVTNPDKSNLPLIPNTKPGMLIARMKLETSAKEFADVPLNLNWTGEAEKYKTKIIAFDGSKNYSVTDAQNHLSELTTLSKGNESEETVASIPTDFSLLQNYPNPFNPSTVINYSLPENSFVSLKVYDITGKEILTLVNEKKDAGRYEVSFDGSNLASGMYFYKIQAGSFSKVMRMVLIK